jgi:P27 family predicted phage terminase small subunit
MKRTGPPRKPTVLKIVAGTYRKDRAVSNEPKPKLEAPFCPSHLDGEAKKEWRRIVPELLSLGLLSKIDRASLAAYCQAYGRWVEAEKKLTRPEDWTTISPKGYEMQSPYLAIANRALEHMRVFLLEFGMTPASRSRIHVVPPEGPKSKLDRFLHSGTDD